MRILNREYDVETDEIKGIEKLEREQLRGVGKCKLSRQIVILDETAYTINSDGEPEITPEAQEEYEDFTSRIRRSLEGEGGIILDEGYGEGEDDLEWHITAYVMDDTACKIVGIMEIDTCVRTEDHAD